MHFKAKLKVDPSCGPVEVENVFTTYQIKYHSPHVENHFVETTVFHKLCILSRSRVRCGGSFERRRYYLSATIVELT